MKLYLQSLPRKADVVDLSSFDVEELSYENWVSLQGRKKKITRCLLSPSLVAIPAGAFYGLGAFRGFDLLTSMDLPPTITWIGAYAFFNCRSLVNVNGMSELQLDTIEECTFYGCLCLVEVILPKRLKNIKAQAFAHCASLRNLHLRGSIMHIAPNAFEPSGLANNVLLVNHRESQAHWKTRITFLMCLDKVDKDYRHVVEHNGA